VVIDPESEQFANHTLDLLNAGITKFKYMSAVIADQVVMLLICKAALI
jgi:hypothetical protein